MPQLPRIHLNHIAEADWLIALELGRVDDGQPDDHWEGVGENFGFLHASPGGPIVGFKVVGFSIFDTSDSADDRIWTAARFEVPMLALRDASAGEIILAARPFLNKRSTINRTYFSAAIAAEDDPDKALQLWLSCLQAGDSMAHFALGYTLYDMGRHREAYRHLRYYAQISPAGAWNWCWLGKAAEAIGELDEARSAYERAIALSDDEDDTVAPELLARLSPASSRGPTAA